ncbi:hypothetical protein B0H14DRAFT_3897760 [Mycena olivaceomarginata]|nr:hypothetical protein B0H14DRAFT_3897760 [Mycena olivaceomarginata]
MEPPPYDTCPLVSVGALHINGVAFCDSTTSKMPLYNDNPDGDWTAAHLALFHRFADYLTDSDRFDKPPLASPPQYNDWVYEIRECHRGVKGLPPFSDDYSGPIPRKVLVSAHAPEVVTNDTFAELYIRSQLANQEKQAEIQNMGFEALIRQGIAAGQRKSGFGPKTRGFFNNAHDLGMAAMYARVVIRVARIVLTLVTVLQLAVGRVPQLAVVPSTSHGRSFSRACHPLPPPSLRRLRRHPTQQKRAARPQCRLQHLQHRLPTACVAFVASPHAATFLVVFGLWRSRFRLSRTTDLMRIASSVRIACDNPSPSPVPRSTPPPPRAATILRISPLQAPSIACAAPPICTPTAFSHRRRLSYPCRRDDPLRHSKLDATHYCLCNAQLRDPRKGRAAVFSARSPRTRSGKIPRSGRPQQLRVRVRA